ncbi:ATP-dependent DNA helicase PIF1 [Holothuria leucospilota]|uniref:ATP-dependent DNA helicase PIF1 n=1 Tax=Holothuria leucospilota TaxID=206669 RepID=A0A9Q1HG26_HOLLE|nr:ATP-dependent DNA helicase PIF1 [Holothuria leucospilota]
MLHSLQSRVEFIEAVDIIGTANATLKKLLKPTQNAKSTLPAELNIAIGARVMLTTNLDVADGLVNGVTGKVTGIVHGNLPNNQPEAIWILFDNPRIGANCRRKYLPPANVAQGSVVILPHKEIYQIRLQHVTRQQFPLKLAWAFTIHKVQGMTMERATVSFTGIFQAGMAYVALSRVVTLGGLYLTDFDSNLIYCNAEVQDSISNMPRCNLQSSNMLLHSEMNFSILHHNTQSLFCHYKDIISNPEFMKADIICLSETWLTSVKLHCIHIPGYNLHCSNQQARGQGVAIYICEKYRYTFIPLETGQCHSLLVATHTIPSFLILMLYRPPSITTTHFLSLLVKALNQMETCHQIYNTDYKVILGDFNYDLLKLPSLGPLKNNN